MEMEQETALSPLENLCAEAKETHKENDAFDFEWWKQAVINKDASFQESKCPRMGGSNNGG